MPPTVIKLIIKIKYWFCKFSNLHILFVTFKTSNTPRLKHLSDKSKIFPITDLPVHLTWVLFVQSPVFLDKWFAWSRIGDLYVTIRPYASLSSKSDYACRTSGTCGRPAIGNWLEKSKISRLVSANTAALPARSRGTLRRRSWVYIL